MGHPRRTPAKGEFSVKQIIIFLMVTFVSAEVAFRLRRHSPLCTLICVGTSPMAALIFILVRASGPGSLTNSRRPSAISRRFSFSPFAASAFSGGIPLEGRYVPNPFFEARAVPQLLYPWVVWVERRFSAASRRAQMDSVVSARAHGLKPRGK